MKAVNLGALNIMVGESNCVLVGGMESMTNCPGLILNYRKGLKFGHSTIKDHVLYDGFEDAFQNKLMGNFAEITASKHNITREMQDEFCVKSYERSLNSMQNGIFDWEIAGVQTNKGLITQDEEPKHFQKKKIFTLKPVFEENGTVTGANASKINDGGCGLLLVNQKVLDKFGFKPLAEIVSFADAELQPDSFNETPTFAVQKLLSK